MKWSSSMLGLRNHSSMYAISLKSHYRNRSRRVLKLNSNEWYSSKRGIIYAESISSSPDALLSGLRNQLISTLGVFCCVLLSLLPSHQESCKLRLSGTILAEEKGRPTFIALGSRTQSAYLLIKLFIPRKMERETKAEIAALAFLIPFLLLPSKSSLWRGEQPNFIFCRGSFIISMRNFRGGRERWNIVEREKRKSHFWGVKIFRWGKIFAGNLWPPGREEKLALVSIEDRNLFLVEE